MSTKLSHVPGLMGNEPTSSVAFPATFNDFFCCLQTEPDEGEDLVVALLEDKLLPRPSGPNRHGFNNMSATSAEQLLRQQVRRGVYSRRSFHRRQQPPTPESSPLSYYPGYMPSPRTASPSSSVACAASRRRASSIAVTRPPPDLNRFLQSEQLPNSRPVSPRGPPQPPPRTRTASMPAVTRHKPMLGQMRRSPIATTSSAGDDGTPTADYYRVRSFSITPSGIYNLGDSFRSRRSRSVTSVGSTGSGSGHSESQRERQPSCASQSSTASIVGLPQPVPRFKVAMLGGSGVGKTSLTCQFTTSEYICAYDTSLDEEFGQKIVSVMLDGQEADLEIIDHPSSEMSVEAFCSTYHPDVFVVVYSLIDRKTLQVAEDILQYLWKQDYIATRGVILVGNKADLERKRDVPMAVGRRLANSCGCKFIETSSGLDHNVDELLVGILAQVQLNPRREQREYRRRHSRTSNWLPSSPGSTKSTPTNPPSSKAKPRGRFGSGRRILRHLLSGIKRKTRSCENLLIL